MKRALPDIVVLLCFVFLASICTVSAVQAAPSIPEWQLKWDKLVEAGKKEGSVSIYTTAWPSELRTALNDAFKKKYGINVEFSSFTRGAELAARYTAEKNGGLRIADIFGAGPPTLTILMKRNGFLSPLEPLFILPEVKNPMVWENGKIPFLEKDKMAIAMIGGIQPSIMYNTTLIKKEEITSYKDLLKPQYKGKITMNDPTVTGAGNAFMAFLGQDIWNVKEAGDYLTQLVKQGVVLQRDNRVHAEEVARGKFAIAIAPNRNNAAKHLELGSPVAFASAKEGAFVVPPSGAVAPSSAPAHPNATAVFLNWVLTKEGQTIFARNFGSPSLRTDVQQEGFPSILLPQPGIKVFYHIEDSEQFVKFQEEMMKMAKKITAEYVK